MTHSLCCDWLKLYRDIIQIDRDILSVLWLVEIICRVLTQTANHRHQPIARLPASDRHQPSFESLCHVHKENMRMNVIFFYFIATMLNHFDVISALSSRHISILSLRTTSIPTIGNQPKMVWHRTDTKPLFHPFMYSNIECLAQDCSNPNANELEFVCLSVCPSVYPSVCLSVSNITKKKRMNGLREIFRKCGNWYMEHSATFW